MNDNKAAVIVTYTLMFIVMLAVIFIGGRYVRRLPGNVVKKVNQISFGAAVGSGILLYLFSSTVFIYLFLASLMCYFLFFNYREET